MERSMRNLLWAGLLVVLGLAVMRWEPFARGTSERRLAYSQVIRELRGGRILDATLEGDRITGHLASGIRYFADVPDDATRGRLLAALETQQERQPSLTFDVRASAVSERLQAVLVSVLIPLGAIVLLWTLFRHQAQNSAPLLHGTGDTWCPAAIRRISRGCAR